MKTYEAYGFRFPTHYAACRYRALLRILEKADVDPVARLRMGQRFIEKYEGVPR
jgi:hypothetical protein